ncbi:hypothetical protein C4D60_Mb05t05410 [Musa balbisiana]|uniref:Uncharacterized protein n=1 Tax=Musa balbisiana TaxID=52838 RepID=A0A4S8JTX0_MUSBA|nr:hypothetical protein C4D60_Mb05t05410 [Musa balbisiana]
MPFWFPFLPSHGHQSTKGGNKLFGFPLPRIKISIQICVHGTNRGKEKSLKPPFYEGLGEERGTESKSYD